MTDLLLKHGASVRISSDDRPKFAAKAVHQWLRKIDVRTLFITPGSLGKNGYNEAFNGRLRNEVLNGEFFYSPREAQVIIK